MGGRWGVRGFCKSSVIEFLAELVGLINSLPIVAVVKVLREIHHEMRVILGY